jgi:hypothetical protein
LRLLSTLSPPPFKQTHTNTLTYNTQTTLNSTTPKPTRLLPRPALQEEAALQIAMPGDTPFALDGIGHDTSVGVVGGGGGIFEPGKAALELVCGFFVGEHACVCVEGGGSGWVFGVSGGVGVWMWCLGGGCVCVRCGWVGGWGCCCEGVLHM